MKWTTEQLAQCRAEFEALRLDIGLNPSALHGAWFGFQAAWRPRQEAKPLTVERPRNCLGCVYSDVECDNCNHPDGKLQCKLGSPLPYAFYKAPLPPIPSRETLEHGDNEPCETCLYFDRQCQKCKDYRNWTSRHAALPPMPSREAVNMLARKWMNLTHSFDSVEAFTDAIMALFGGKV